MPIELTGQLAPKNDADFPIAEGKDIKGGMPAFADLTAANNFITNYPNRLQKGQLCYIEADSNHYKLNNAMDTWELNTVDPTSIGNVVTTTETSIADYITNDTPVDPDDIQKGDTVILGNNDAYLYAGGGILEANFNPINLDNNKANLDASNISSASDWRTALGVAETDAPTFDQLTVSSAPSAATDVARKQELDTKAGTDASGIDQLFKTTWHNAMGLGYEFQSFNATDTAISVNMNPTGGESHKGILIHGDSATDIDLKITNLNDTDSALVSAEYTLIFGNINTGNVQFQADDTLFTLEDGSADSRVWNIPGGTHKAFKIVRTYESGVLRHYTIYPIASLAENIIEQAESATFLEGAPASAGLRFDPNSGVLNVMGTDGKVYRLKTGFKEVTGLVAGANPGQDLAQRVFTDGTGGGFLIRTIEGIATPFVFSQDTEPVQLATGISAVLDLVESYDFEWTDVLNKLGMGTNFNVSIITGNSDTQDADGKPLMQNAYKPIAGSYQPYLTVGGKVY
jgi:hypothetical protein